MFFTTGPDKIDPHNSTISELYSPLFIDSVKNPRKEHINEDTRKRKNFHDKVNALYRKFELEKSMPQFQAKVRFNHDRQDIPIHFTGILS